MRQGKGKKDRLFLLSDKFLNDFTEYIVNRINNNEYVFNDYDGGHITIRNAQRIVKNAARNAEITKRVHCHILRASFATHLFEEGVNESYIQKLMGHASKKTLERYLAVRIDEALKVKSPLDTM